MLLLSFGLRMTASPLKQSVVRSEEHHDDRPTAWVRRIFFFVIHYLTAGKLIPNCTAASRSLSSAWLFRASVCFLGTGTKSYSP